MPTTLKIMALVILLVAAVYAFQSGVGWSIGLVVDAYDDYHHRTASELVGDYAPWIIGLYGAFVVLVLVLVKCVKRWFDI